MKAIFEMNINDKDLPKIIYDLQMISIKETVEVLTERMISPHDVTELQKLYRFKDYLLNEKNNLTLYDDHISYIPELINEIRFMNIFKNNLDLTSRINVVPIKSIRSIDLTLSEGNLYIEKGFGERNGIYQNSVTEMSIKFTVFNNTYNNIFSSKIYNILKNYIF